MADRCSYEPPPRWRQQGCSYVGSVLHRRTFRSMRGERRSRTAAVARPLAFQARPITVRDHNPERRVGDSNSTRLPESSAFETVTEPRLLLHAKSTGTTPKRVVARHGQLHQVDQHRLIAGRRRTLCTPDGIRTRANLIESQGTFL